MHAGAKASDKGMACSKGCWVNDLYDLGQTKKTHLDIATATQVATSKPVRRPSATVQHARQKESSS